LRDASPTALTGHQHATDAGYDPCFYCDGWNRWEKKVSWLTQRIAIALNRYAKGGAGFSDQMIALAGIGAGCEVTVTFDRKAAQGRGM
jgi:hypothetical protein